ncbi:DUF3488 and transglutaminase-like domain-containing protein [Bdellovibrio bacteriovorus]|uniref:transglutaminase TgpA family protein n=1 Tax=Bdellovibrio bacteriovorus TaxID=959 RepID=UPI0021D268BE|nr:DUF3488 and transglutaminase-like domain-containing protein [Bdellovibrio bacteriovorus]UXR65771.1 DUF3488 and transglutaminase-like domain-containing protein [Bdellovibrio bacteriovorus]
MTDRKFFSQKALAFSFVTAMVMVGIEVSPWIAFSSVGLLIWKWGVENLKWKPLSKKVTGVLSIALLVQILLQFRTFIGQEPSYTFLLGLSGLRVMDYRNERDHRFLVLLGFVLVSVKALFSLDIYWIIPSALAFAGLWYSLLPGALPHKGRVLLKVFALSVPAAVIMFFAFPRVVLPWAMSRGSNTGQIGFSEELNPGNVAELAGISTMVFRAKLSETGIKNAENLYWRGSVLPYSRGLSWRPGTLGLRAPEKGTEVSKSSLYEIALEPHSNTYLFVLDGTSEVQLEQGRTMSLNGDIYRSARPLMTTTVYRAKWSEGSKDTLAPDEDYLRTPEMRGRVLEWVEQTKKDAAGTEERLQALQDLFAKNDFTYSLNPGVYGGPNDLEAFLFYRKRGFCEHFAGAYATLARSLGIPSRVVVGYQGGRYNPMGDFWRVTQRDAHAWVEVFHQGVWQRKDPTSWVAPLRLVIGAEDFFNLSEEDQKVFARNVQWRPSKDSGITLWDRAEFLIDDLNYRWTYFLVDFDRSSQKSFWQSLADMKLQMILGLIFVTVIGVLLFRSLFRTKGLVSEERVLFLAVQKWAEKRNQPQESGETPLHYLTRLAEENPQQREALRDIGHFIDQKAYAGERLERQSQHLLRLWKQAVEKGS